MLNSIDGTYMTAFIPHDEALRAFKDFNRDRYASVLNGGDPGLLQKVCVAVVLHKFLYTVSQYHSVNWSSACHLEEHR